MISSGIKVKYLKVFYSSRFKCKRQTFRKRTKVVSGFAGLKR